MLQQVNLAKKKHMMTFIQAKIKSKALSTLKMNAKIKSKNVLDNLIKKLDYLKNSKRSDLLNTGEIKEITNSILENENIYQNINEDYE